MRITIIGWYGTETIGDRAILAGLLSLFSEAWGKLNVRLGCLGEVLSERTLLEDSEFYTICTKGKDINISLFDSRNKKELDTAIMWCDIVCMGGGPLMEMSVMYMPYYAFKKAVKEKKKTIVAGCGMGPFATDEYRRIAKDMVDMSSLAIFRDAKSLDIYSTLSSSKRKAYSSVDPAAFAADIYNQHYPKLHENYIAMNFREPTLEYGKCNDKEFFVNYVSSVLSKSSDEQIRLVPMHTFHMGGDDRTLLNYIARRIGNSRIEVCNRPLSLFETMKTYSDAKACVGMRFHSVLLQTFLNGRNVIMDYTDPKKGKTINLLRQLHIENEVSDRYYSLVNNEGILMYDYTTLGCIELDKSMINDFRNVYIEKFKSL